MDSPTGQTRRRIFSLYRSNDADSRKDVPFGVSLTLLPILGVKYPQNPIFGAWIGVFKPNVQNIESFMLRNYCIDFSEILHNDRDHQDLLVGCPNRRPTNPRWRTAAISKKPLNRYISSTV